eukprot:CAMPEP_0178555552 /NCGR_PEP_ID=MMETSP0697-20121206/8924_1 /TAXON_ID=265572 /ORGANISM="Extubocellulus spinifer, Strain CCMP396" /LENGTH=414 /DNA_ID=CAMNT_0020188569 /DNA_START=140 /DNA_END=1387 /DNA_ORIENTATION=-
MMMNCLRLLVVVAALTEAFHPAHLGRPLSSKFMTTTPLHASSNGTNSNLPRAEPRIGILQSLLDIALNSPLWKLVLVPQARANIVKTAESNGVRWNEALRWIKAQEGPWRHSDRIDTDYVYPGYYMKPFHSYEDGNINWDAAFEQELAGRAVGARNFPQFGEGGEDAFREAFDKALDKLGAVVPRDATIVDLGCGTGTSTRRLAKRFPDAERIIGIDLSAYFIAVGKRLLELAPKGAREGGPWVTTIEPDSRIELVVGDAASTEMPDESVDIVNIGLVVHELPTAVSKDICKEALRILKPGGQLFVTEMDFDSPAFSAQRANPLLFSLIRSTEPYLDEYADGCAELREYIAQEYASVRIGAATGRHYALVATKPSGGSRRKAETGASIIDDRRFVDGNYAVADTHLKTWESKKT